MKIQVVTIQFLHKNQTLLIYLFLQQQNIPKELRVWSPIQNKLLCEVQDFGGAHVSGSKL